MLKKTARKLLFKDAYSRIYEDVNGILHVVLACGEVIIPSPERYEGFTAATFAELYEELKRSGIPADVAGRWTNQAQGFDGV